MKRFVSADATRDIALGAAAFALALAVDAGPALSYLILLSLLAVVIWRGNAQSASWRKPQ
jgi:hypothetical protein